MKKLIQKWTKPEGGAQWPGLIVLSALFLCGAVAGCITAARVNGVAEQALPDTLRGYISLLQGETQTGALIGRAFFNAFKYHVAVFLLGFTMLGVGVAPLITATKGFFLSFSITAFIKAFGLSGLWFSLGAFGVQALVSLPCLFYLSMRSMTASASLLGAVAGKYKRPLLKGLGATYLFPFAICTVILCLTALFETFVSPPLLRLITTGWSI